MSSRWRFAWRPAVARDPVTGKERDVLRRTAVAQSSPRLLAYQRCVGDQMRGWEAPAGTAAQRAAAVRDRFREAARACS